MAVFQNSNKNITQEVANGTGTSSVVGNLFVTTNVTVEQDINVTGNSYVGGNLIVDGNITYINIENLQVQDPIISLGRGPNGQPLTVNDHLDRGTEMWFYTTAEHTAFVGFINATGNVISASNVSVSNNIVTVNDYGTFQTGTVYSSSILTTTFSAIGNITAGNLITSGIVSAGSNIIGANILTSGIVSATGNVIGGNLITSALVQGTTVSATGNVIGGNLITSALVQGTTVSATGNVIGGNINTAGKISASGNVIAGNIETAGQVSASIYYDYNAPGYFVDPAGTSSLNNVSLTGRVIAGSGSAASPSFAFSADGAVDTGFFWVSDGYIGITNNSSQSGAFGPGTLSMVGTITGGNLATGGNVSATGDVAGGSITSSTMINPSIGYQQLIAGGALSFANAGVSVDFAGGLSAPGNITGGNVLGVIRPTAGTGTNGIVFPANPGGGGGDLATIQYYASSGENTVLELKVTNDATDVILLNASGGTSVTGNVTAGNVITPGIISADGNIITTAFFIGDGSYVSNAAFAGNTISYGLSNVKIPSFSGNVTMTVNGTPNVVVVSSDGIVVSGNVNAGNLVGTLVGNITTTGNVSTVGNIIGGNVIANSDVIAANVKTSAFVSAAGTVTGSSLLGSVVSASANITGGNLLTAGLISTGGDITTAGNISAGNITLASLGAVRSTSVIAGYLTANAATGIALYVPTADASVGGNVLVGGVVSAAGNITGNYFFGNGSQLTGVVAVGIGTLTSLSVTGTTTTGNLITGGVVSATGNITGSYIIGDGSQLTGLPAGYSNAIAAAYFASGNNSSNIVTTANVSGAYIIGDGSQLTGLPAGYSNAIAAAYFASGNDTSNIVTTANVTGGNLTTGGIVSASGNVLGAYIVGDVFTGNIYHSGSNGVGNIGSSSSYFNTVFAKATSAQYADLAENYQSDAEYTPGTVLDFGGEKEVTLSVEDSSRRVAGVVSTHPAHLMNSVLEGNHVVAIALVGRVPVNVVGKIAKGDLMVSAGNGRARAENNPAVGTVIGKSLEHFDGDQGTIEVVINMQ